MLGCSLTGNSAFECLPFMHSKPTTVDAVYLHNPSVFHVFLLCLSPFNCAAGLEVLAIYFKRKLQYWKSLDLEIVFNCTKSLFGEFLCVVRAVAENLKMLLDYLADFFLIHTKVLVTVFFKPWMVLFFLCLLQWNLVSWRALYFSSLTKMPLDWSANRLSTRFSNVIFL